MLVFSWKTSFAVADYNLFFFCLFHRNHVVREKERKKEKKITFK
jgi:hypothetical protein